MKCLRNFFVSVFFLFISYSIWAIPDSLSISDNLSKSLKLSYNNSDSAFYYCNLSIIESEEIKSDYLLAKSFNIKGIIYDNINKWDSAIIMYDKAIEIAKRGNYKSVIASALNNKGLVKWNRSKLSEAIEFYNKSLLVFKELENDKGIANTLNNISLLFWEQFSFEKALEYQLKALSYRKKLNDSYGIGVSFTNLGLIYTDLRKYDSARFYLNKAISHKLINNEEYGLAIAYTNYASFFMNHINQIDSAAIYFKLASKIHEKSGNSKLAASNLSSLAWVYHLQNKNLKALSTLENALQYAEESKSLKEKYGIITRLGKVNEALGNYKKSSDFYEKAINLYQDLYQFEKDKKIIEIQTKYETAEKEKQIANQNAKIAKDELKIKRRNFWLFTTFAALSSFVIFFFLIYRQQKLKQKNLLEQNNLKLKLEKSKFNNELNEQKLSISRDLHDNIGSRLSYLISSLDNIVYANRKLNDEFRKKVEHLNDFAAETINELRDTIWAMDKNNISCKQFSAKVSQYCEQVSADRQDVEIEVYTSNSDKLINSIQAINLLRIIQEAINNAMKYSESEKIFIVVKVVENTLVIEVNDNGKGFDLHNINKGYGLKNIKDRGVLINAEVNINSEVNRGTEIRVRLFLK